MTHVLAKRWPNKTSPFSPCIYLLHAAMYSSARNNIGLHHYRDEVYPLGRTSLLAVSSLCAHALLCFKKKKINKFISVSSRCLPNVDLKLSNVKKEEMIRDIFSNQTIRLSLPNVLLISTVDQIKTGVDPRFFSWGPLK